jgi:hypothetical protein
MLTYGMYRNVGSDNKGGAKTCGDPGTKGKPCKGKKNM